MKLQRVAEMTTLLVYTRDNRWDTFKSTFQILDELSTKWAGLTDIQQASVTELLAG